MNVDRREVSVGLLGQHDGRATGATTQVEPTLDPQRVGQQPQRATGGLDAAGTLPRCVFEELEQQRQIVSFHGVTVGKRS